MNKHEMKMRRNCRIWWPRQLTSSELSSSSILFGWFISSSPASLDIVVAFTCSAHYLSQFRSGLKGILQDTDSNMPISLRDKAMFSLLGSCAKSFSSTGEVLNSGKEFNQRKSSRSRSPTVPGTKADFNENHGRWNCGCHNLDGLSEQWWQASTGNNNQVLLMYDSDESLEVNLIPRLHHVHLNGQKISDYDVHVIYYDTPLYNGHHFSLQLWDSSRQGKSPMKKPKWVEELQLKQYLFDLDTVILAINCAAAAKISLERHLCSRRSAVRFSIIEMFVSFTWYLLAMSIASISTFYYIILRILYSFSSSLSQLWIRKKLENIFSTAWINICIRCCQILYWPIKLQENGPRAQSNVENAEKSALEKHSIWSSLTADVLLGSAVGLTVLHHAESISSLILDFSKDITNNFLRSGCVWLMGVPAGFKLNTELAGALGLFSLNVIQIWSTLWIFLGFAVIYLTKALAILGILFGLTIPAAFIIDLITLATAHVSTLHLLISLLYSSQIQALAALWRLFGGRKWNPLRQRLDSYNYSVKQHIVGSLLFTLLLLLLPTTSVFYIFFTIMKTTISFINMMVEVTISVIHATPYIKIFLWFVRPRRFPSGIWFEIVCCQNNTTVPAKEDFIDSLSENLLQKKDTNKEKTSVLVSSLHSNFLGIGEVVLPHYSEIFSRVSGSTVASSFRGILTGKRITSTLGTGLPSLMPWMFIPYKEYWCLCRDSILSCIHRRAGT